MLQTFLLLFLVSFFHIFTVGLQQLGIGHHKEHSDLSRARRFISLVPLLSRRLDIIIAEVCDAVTCLLVFVQHYSVFFSCESNGDVVFNLPLVRAVFDGIEVVALRCFGK